jgi:hypothetical protein
VFFSLKGKPLERVGRKANWPKSPKEIWQQGCQVSFQRKSFSDLLSLWDGRFFVVLLPVP